MTGDTRPQWERLGTLLIRRRIEIDPKYSNRSLFARERGLPIRIVTDIELGKRDNYEGNTIALMESAYALAPGAISQVVSGETDDLAVSDAAAATGPRPVLSAVETGAPQASAGVTRALVVALEAANQGRAAQIEQEIRAGDFHPEPGILVEAEEKIIATSWDPARKATEIAKLRAALGEVMPDARRKAQ